jgi:hypothetical protein
VYAHKVVRWLLASAVAAAHEAQTLAGTPSQFSKDPAGLDLIWFGRGPQGSPLRLAFMQVLSALNREASG